MFMYNPIGKTLAEIHKDCGSKMGGYSVFVLQNEDDTIGEQLDEDFSIGMILKKHPQYSNCKVKYENDFYGMTVLRIEKGGAEAMAELKPCPFCGGEAEIYDDKNQTYSVGVFGECRNGVPTYYKVFCKECSACGAVAKVEKGCSYNSWWQNQAKAQAIKLWNTRATQKEG